MELAIWTHYILNELKPELLEDVPEAKVDSVKAVDTSFFFEESATKVLNELKPELLENIPDSVKVDKPMLEEVESATKVSDIPEEPAAKRLKTCG